VILAWIGDDKAGYIRSLDLDPCYLNVGMVKLDHIQSAPSHHEYDPARRTLRDSPRRGYANESIVVELGKMTLATVDGAFELESDRF
jgi:hypothetical protein